MPSEITEKLARHGEGTPGTPRRVQLRITWPDDDELQDDSEEKNSKVFVLEQRDADKPGRKWAKMGNYRTKAEAQVAADAVVGRNVEVGEWKDAAVSWRTYEEAAAFLLNCFVEEFGIDRVEGKQHVTGGRTGTEYEIDAKGVRVADGGLMVVECRRYTTSRQNQEKVGALAYRILDMGAFGAIIVSPLGLQAGAKKVAAAENIISVKLDEDSTPEHFAAEFLGKFRAGATMPMFICGGPPDQGDAGKGGN
jgi:hypothetical protein